jgi:microsomal dipeptidase-like Zn-dependent dipeptidase
MGIDHVGIGTDFDGDGGVPGVANAAELSQVTRRLLDRGYSYDDIQKIWAMNIIRVMMEVQNAKA